MVGVVYNVQPQPAAEEDTRWFRAGAVTFGVEYRVVDPEALAATYGDEQRMAEIEEKSPEGGFADTGVSIHVVGAATGTSTCASTSFDGEPHYHYVPPAGDHNNVVAYDTVAHGDMLTFAVECLRSRLGDMLRHAHGDEIAASWIPSSRVPVIDEVEAAAIRCARRPASVSAAGGRCARTGSAGAVVPEHEVKALLVEAWVALARLV